MNRNVFLGAAFIVLATPVIAQEVISDQQVNELEEVVLSDSKFALKREKSGKVITKITSEELEKSQGQTLAQVLNRVAGVRINGSQSAAGTDLGVYVRGGRNRQVLIRIDGLTVNDPSSSANDFDLRLIALNQIESIEILKGASKANALLQSFDINQSKSRHLKILTEDLSNTLTVVNDEESWKEEINASMDLEANQAYLITAKNDTLLVDINTKDIENIAYDVKIIKYDNSKSPIGSEIKNASQCKEVLVIGGVRFKNINFKEVSMNQAAYQTTQTENLGSKLSKVLFESDIISLYLFNNKETVLKYGTDEREGISTLSKDFVFNFTNKLSSIAKDSPELQQKVQNNMYKNTPESLLQFCQDFTMVSKN